MSIHVTGWVECKNPASEWYFDEWAPAINLDPLLDDEADLRYEPPFTDMLAGKGPLAPGHGLPDDVSRLVAKDAGGWNAPWFATWLTWGELKSLNEREPTPDDWRLVLAMVEPLAAVCGDDGVRMILWDYITDYGRSDG
ncbi:MAG TPA: hypothetical protein VFQ25_10370 [Ktedonobacterales bacterium]|nr:hypothetical protein [Ktedonobacterales bacterium]